jgi:hypothetical protein
MRFEIGGDAAQVDRLGGEGAVGLAVGDGCQEVDSAVVFRPAEAGVGFADVEHVEKVIRREEIDVSKVDDPAAVGDEQGWRPDHVERTDNGTILEKIESQGHEAVRDGGLDPGVWIRHGIQLLAAASGDFHDVDQDGLAGRSRFVQRSVPVGSPGE